MSREPIILERLDGIVAQLAPFTVSAMKMIKFQVEPFPNSAVFQYLDDLKFLVEEELWIPAAIVFR
jgi:hypothetical protein